MCIVCDELKKADRSAVAKQISNEALGATKPEIVMARGIELYCEANASDEHKEAVSQMYARAFAEGVFHTADSIGPTVEMQTVTLGRLINRIGTFARAYAGTPSVMTDLEPLLETMQSYVQHNITLATQMLLDRAEKSGVRKSLVKGEENPESLLPEELAMIAERFLEANGGVISGLRLSATVGSLMSKLESKAAVGLGVVNSYAGKYTFLKEASADYLLGDDKKFGEFLKGIGHHVGYHA